MVLSLWGCLGGGAVLGVVPGDLIAKPSEGETRSEHGVVSFQRCRGDRASPFQQSCAMTHPGRLTGSLGSCIFIGHQSHRGGAPTN